MVKMNLP